MRSSASSLHRWLWISIALLLAVLAGSPLGAVWDLDDLILNYPGILEILETWFASYKGPGEIKLNGLGDRAQAETILQAAIEAYDDR